MNEQSVPLLSDDGISSFGLPKEPIFSTPLDDTPLPSTVHGSSVPEQSSSQDTQVTHEETKVDEETKTEDQQAANQTYQAIEGFLAVCGNCNSKILFPLGKTRVDCSKCNAINYLNPQAIPSVPRKALLYCPKCNATILYTIGCTHFQCTCGCVIEIPIPNYYIPYVGHC